jgi:hypothetical protein
MTELDTGLVGQHGREGATAPLGIQRTVLEGVLIDELVEGLFECARHFARRKTRTSLVCLSMVSKVVSA